MYQCFLPHMSVFAEHHFLFSLLFSPFSHFTAGKKACSHSDPWGVTSPVLNTETIPVRRTVGLWCTAETEPWNSANNQYQHCLFPRLRHYCAAPLSRLNVTACRQNCLTRWVPPCWRDGCGLTAAEGCHISLYETFSALMLEGGEGTAALSNARS